MLSIVRFFENREDNLVGDMGSCGGGHLARPSPNEWARGHEGDIDLMCLCLVSVCDEEGDYRWMCEEGTTFEEEKRESLKNAKPFLMNCIVMNTTLCDDMK